MKNFLFILTLFFILDSYGQQIVILSKDYKQAIVGAKVKCVTNETLHKTLISDSDGTVMLPSNALSVQVTSVGFDTLNLTRNDFPKDLNIFLKPSTLFDEVVVTAQYEPVLAHNAIQKIRVITQDQIEQSGSNNLVDILNYEAGIRLSQDNILGSSMSLGGLSGQNVKILIDGVPVIGRQNGNLDLSQINLDNIERIEVVEGPLSVTYGTNALAGTINLITKKQSKNTVNFQIKPYYESIGNYNLTAALGFKIKRQQIRISGGRNYFDGWSSQDPFFQFPKSRPADTNRFKQWKPKEQLFGEIRYSTTIKGWSFSPYGRYFGELITNRGLPYAPYFETGIDDYYDTKRLDVGTGIDKKWKKYKMNVILAYNEFTRKKNTYIKDLTNLEQSLSTANGSQDTSKFSLFNARLAFNKEISKKIKLELGTDLNYETAYGKRIEGLLKDQGVYAAYSTLEWNVFKNMTIKPGLRYGYNTTYVAPLTPSFNALYKVKDVNYRVSFARGFRAPTLKELYFDFVDINHNIQGNIDLRPEYSMNYTAGVSWMKKIKANQLLRMSYDFFYNDIDNLITLGALPDNSYTYINIGQFKSVGNQVKLDYKSKKLSLGLNTAIIGRYNKLNAEQTSIRLFAFSPEIGLNGSYKIIKDHLQFNVFYKYNGALISYGFNADEEIVENRQSAYNILDMSVGSKFWKKRIEVVLGVKNILNVTEVQVVGANPVMHSAGGNLNAARGTSVFMTLKYKINYDFKTKK